MGKVRGNRGKGRYKGGQRKGGWDAGTLCSKLTQMPQAHPCPMDSGLATAALPQASGSWDLGCYACPASCRPSPGRRSEQLLGPEHQSLGLWGIVMGTD